MLRKDNPSMNSLMRGSRGDLDPSPIKRHKNIAFLSNTGLDPPKNHKVISHAFNVGPSLAHQQNAI